MIGVVWGSILVPLSRSPVYTRFAWRVLANFHQKKIWRLSRNTSAGSVRSCRKDVLKWDMNFAATVWRVADRFWWNLPHFADRRYQTHFILSLLE
jgi:hypothetical protein